VRLDAGQWQSIASAKKGRNMFFPCGQVVDRIDSTAPLCDGKECQRLQNAKNFLVAATFEKANTYVFAGIVIMNPTL